MANTDIKKLYKEEVIPGLMKEFGYENIMQVPKLEKIVLNMGIGEAARNSKKLESAIQDLRLVSGQKPIITKAKKSIAAFKIRTGMNVGLKVTLRQERMYDFLQKLVFIAIPRIRDFRGLNDRSFDGRGNYSMGVKEQTLFPELVDFRELDTVMGMDIIFVTTAPTDEEGKALLKGLGMPFKQAQVRKG